MKALEIQTIAHLPMHIRALESEAIAEGFRFLTRLISEWHSGAIVSMHQANALWRRIRISN
jgi:hypothetical protein